MLRRAIYLILLLSFSGRSFPCNLCSFRSLLLPLFAFLLFLCSFLPFLCPSHRERHEACGQESTNNRNNTADRQRPSPESLEHCTRNPRRREREPHRRQHDKCSLEGFYGKAVRLEISPVSPVSLDVYVDQVPMLACLNTPLSPAPGRRGLVRHYQQRRNAIAGHAFFTPFFFGIESKR